MMLTRDARVAKLATRWIDVPDLLLVRRRTIGTGYIGGKAVGMLLARAILARSDARFERRLEPHDSWFVGSDVFRAYLARNGCGRAHLARRDAAAFLDGGAEARERILAGAFLAPTVDRFRAMLAHFGASPIVVRSSSLLEDGFGNAFAGKYESVFCANQGSPEERLAAFLDAVRRVYASAMGEEALRYREHRGLLDREEQMALLVQRVSGAAHGDLFFPHVAGVALSYNPWAWDAEIDPQAGMLRLVFGLGTRAVGRADQDYTRIVALNAPLRRPEPERDGRMRYAQRRVDLIDVGRNRLDTLPFEEVARRCPGLPLDLYATLRPGEPPVLTFDKLLVATPLVEDVRAMLRTLASVHGYPVVVELTASFAEGELRLDVVQCRPLQLKEGGVAAPPPSSVPEAAVVLASRGPVVGRSTNAPVDRVIFVDPDAYERLAAPERHEVARVVGRLTRLAAAGTRRILLLGPGRWGTKTVELGVPTSFAEIQRVSAICEIVKTGMNAVPDVSLGSHFFNDLVEEDMLYLALYPDRPGYRLAEELLRAEPSRLAALLPGDAAMAGVVRVLDLPLPGDGRSLWLSADCVRQEALCWLQAG